MVQTVVTFEEVKYDPFIYFIGATDGWKSSDQKKSLYPHPFFGVQVLQDQPRGGVFLASYLYYIKIGMGRLPINLSFLCAKKKRRKSRDVYKRQIPLYLVIVNTLEHEA